MIKEFVQIKIKTKPHIKYYLENHFGNPCKIPSGHFIGEYLNILLSRPVKTENHKCVDEPETVVISINKTDFHGYGYGLTITNRRNFNLVINNFIRTQIRDIANNILLNNAINTDWKKKYEELKKENKQLVNLSKEALTTDTLKKYKKVETLINKRLDEHHKHRIEEKEALMQAVYDVLGFSEDILSFESIKKDFYRYKSAQKL
jgi:hypothetical protein